MRKTAMILLASLAACAGRTPAPKDAPAGINVDVKTLYDGAEPREELRYHGAVGTLEHLLVRLSLATFVETRTASAAISSPVLELVMRVGDTYRGEGERTWGYPIRFEIIGITGAESLSEKAHEALSQELLPIAKAEGVFEIDDRGITRRADVTVPPGASPRLLAMLGNIRTTLLSAALPKEAVGRGARWEVDRLVKVGPVMVPQTVTYTLLDRAGDVLRLGVSLRQSADAQSVPLSSDGTTLELEAYEVSAVGSTIVNLAGFAPLSEVRGVSQMRGTLRRGAAIEPFAIDGDVIIQIAPLPEGVKAAQTDSHDAPKPSSPGT